MDYLINSLDLMSALSGGPYGVVLCDFLAPAERRHVSQPLSLAPGSVTLLDRPGGRTIRLVVEVGADSAYLREQALDDLFQELLGLYPRLSVVGDDGRRWFHRVTAMGRPSVDLDGPFLATVGGELLSNNPYRTAADPRGTVNVAAFAALSASEIAPVAATTAYGVRFAVPHGGNAPSPVRIVCVNRAGSITPERWLVRNLATGGVCIVNRTQGSRTQPIPAETILIFDPEIGVLLCPATSITALYHFTEGPGSPTLYDASGKNRDLTVVGSAVAGTQGGAITPAVRAANITGDRVSALLTRWGIWRARTNQLANGSFEANITGYTENNSNITAPSLTQSAAHPTFGAQALRHAGTGGVGGGGVLSVVTPSVAAAAGDVKAASASVYVEALPAGASVLIRLTDSLGVTVDGTAITALGESRISVVSGVLGAGVATISARLRVAGIPDGQTAIVHWDGVQIETANAAPFATPFAGDGATRTQPDLVLPAGIFNPAQGSMIVSLVMGTPYNNGLAGSTQQGTAGFRNGNSFISLDYYPGGATWRAFYTNAAGLAHNPPAIAAAAVGQHAAGDRRIVGHAWDLSTSRLFVDAVMSESAVNVIAAPTMGAANATIGTWNGTPADSDVEWFIYCAAKLTQATFDAMRAAYGGGVDPPSLAAVRAAFPEADARFVWAADTLAAYTYGLILQSDGPDAIRGYSAGSPAALEGNGDAAVYAELAGVAELAPTSAFCVCGWYEPTDPAAGVLMAKAGLNAGWSVFHAAGVLGFELGNGATVASILSSAGFPPLREDRRHWFCFSHNPTSARLRLWLASETEPPRMVEGPGLAAPTTSANPFRLSGGNRASTGAAFGNYGRLALWGILPVEPDADAVDRMWRHGPAGYAETIPDWRGMPFELVPRSPFPETDTTTIEIRADAASAALSRSFVLSRDRKE